MTSIQHRVGSTTASRTGLRRVALAIEDTGSLPWDDDLAAAYGDRGTLLVALHDHWSRQLLSRIDVALELGAATPQESVAMAWRSAVRDQPGLRRILDAEAADPALRASRRSLLAAVAVTAGLATFDSPASVSVAAGERFLAEVDASGTAEHRPSLLGRVLRRLWEGPPEADPWPWAS